MAALEIHQFICLKDNYGVLIRDPATNAVAAIDAPNGEEVAAALEAKGWKLTHILNTHRHGDHTDGNLLLKQATGCTIIGPKGEADKVPGIDKAVGEGDTFKLGSLRRRVSSRPAATPRATSAFTFRQPASSSSVIRCSRWAAAACSKAPRRRCGRSLSKLAALPPATKVYCGHEYTLANARFALTIEPENENLQIRVRQVEQQRARGEMTLPTDIALELATNPFLRAASPAIRKNLGLEGAPDWQVFGEVRERKNNS